MPIKRPHMRTTDGGKGNDDTDRGDKAQEGGAESTDQKSRRMHCYGQVQTYFAHYGRDAY